MKIKQFLLGLSVGFVILGIICFVISGIGVFYWGYSPLLPLASALVVIVAAAFVGAIDVDGS